MASRYRRILFCTTFVSALLLLRFTLMRLAQERPYGRYNSRQVVARTEPLCRIVAPEYGSLSLHTEPIVSPQAERPSQSLWNVYAEDRAGNHVAYFIWDADTGDLLWVGHTVHDTSTYGIPLSRDQAIQIAWRYLCNLGFAEKASQWKQTPAPEQVEGSLTVYWQAKDRIITAQISLRSGALRSARSRRTNIVQSPSAPGR